VSEKEGGRWTSPPLFALRFEKEGGGPFLRKKRKKKPASARAVVLMLKKKEGGGGGGGSLMIFFLSREGKKTPPIIAWWRTGSERGREGASRFAAFSSKQRKKKLPAVPQSLPPRPAPEKRKGGRKSGVRGSHRSPRSEKSTQGRDRVCSSQKRGKGETSLIYSSSLVEGEGGRREKGGVGRCHITSVSCACGPGEKKGA